MPTTVATTAAAAAAKIKHGDGVRAAICQARATISTRAIHGVGNNIAEWRATFFSSATMVT